MWHGGSLRRTRTARGERSVSQAIDPEAGKAGTRGSVAGEYLGAAGVVGLTTAVGLALRSRLSTTDMAMLFLLAVVVAATRYRQGPALFASVLGIVAFDLVFVPPYYSFDVHDAAYVLTFGVMLVVGLVMSRLMTRVREQAGEAFARERQTAALLALDRELAGVRTLPELVEITTRHIGRVVGGEAATVLADATQENGAPRWPASGLFDSTEVRVAAAWAYQHAEPAGLGTARCGAAEAMLIPLRTGTRTQGVTAVRPRPPGRSLGDNEYRAATALSDLAAIAIERAILAEQTDAARVEAEAERLRTSLLSSLSHDLRTPLASIEGAASTLLQQSGTLPPDVRRDMAESILEESRRMTRLVSNLLDMIRVETGALAAQKAWQPLEEALGVALLRLDERLGSHAVHVELPADLPLVPIDELLIEQVFINLLENAIKHSPAGTPITVAARQENGAVMVEVADAGPGIPAGLEELVFRKFFRVGGGTEKGAGLGLTICRGIIAAHGGRIWVEQRSGQGASFRFTLPLDGPPLHGVPAEAVED